MFYAPPPWLKYLGSAHPGPNAAALAYLMARRRRAAAAAGLLAATSQLAAAGPGAAAPFVLHNGTIYTMDPSAAYASALCVRGGRIEAVGGDEEVLRSPCAAAALAAGARAVDLRGAAVLPGLTDSHAHLSFEAARRLRADLLGARSAGEAAQAAQAFARGHAALVNASGGWVQGFGWDQTTWPGGAFPTKADLDTLFPEQPVFLQQLSGHACWVNTRALDLVAGDLPASGDPPGGHIERGEDGEPTGVLSDAAMDIVARRIPPYSAADADAALAEVMRDCAAHGLTGVHDLATSAADLALYRRRIRRGDLTLRIYAFMDGKLPCSSPRDPFIATEDGMLMRRAVKFYADGAMGSWSAAMLQPYSDRPKVSGTTVYADSELRGNLSAWAAEGYQIATHAIGDAANQQVLDVYEELMPSARSAAGRGDLRWRVEHAQILAAADVGRFARLGVIPSMQPTHCAADLDYAVQRLGWDRASRGYAWASLLKSGVRALPFGSDFPTAGQIPPLLGLHAAVTRETAEGVPPEGWFPSERVTRTQAVKGYTVDAAVASFREHELGSIRPNFLADLTILDTDVLTVDAPKILGAQVLGTVVGGHVVFAANRSSTSDAIMLAVAQGLAALVPRGARNFHHRGAALAGELASSWLRGYADDVREDSRRIVGEQVEVEVAEVLRV